MACSSIDGRPTGRHALSLAEHPVGGAGRLVSQCHGDRVAGIDTGRLEFRYSCRSLVRTARYHRPWLCRVPRHRRGIQLNPPGRAAGHAMVPKIIRRDKTSDSLSSPFWHALRWRSVRRWRWRSRRRHRPSHARRRCQSGSRRSRKGLLIEPWMAARRHAHVIGYRRSRRPTRMSARPAPFLIHLIERSAPGRESKYRDCCASRTVKRKVHYQQATRNASEQTVGQIS